MMDGSSYTARNEGLRLACYDDKTGDVLKAGDKPVGTPTIGRGHTGHEVKPGLVWTESQCDAAYALDYAEAKRVACAAIANATWAKLDDARKAVLADMAFQMGGAGLRGFPLMLRAVERQDWRAAHDECLDSDYARRDAANRALRNALALLDGNLRPAP